MTAESTGTGLTPNDIFSAQVTETGKPIIDKLIDLTEDAALKGEEKPSEVERKSPELTVCPACGADLKGQLDIQPSDADKTRWLRHVLGESRFTGDYELLGGTVKVRFRSRTTRENDAVFAILTEDIREGNIPETPAFASPGYMAKMNRLFLACSLANLEIKHGPNMPPSVIAYEPLDKGALAATRVGIAEVHDKVISAMSEGFLALLLSTHSRFEALMLTMIRHGNDPDFWKPAVDGIS